MSVYGNYFILLLIPLFAGGYWVVLHLIHVWFQANNQSIDDWELPGETPVDKFIGYDVGILMFALTLLVVVILNILPPPFDYTSHPTLHSSMLFILCIALSLVSVWYVHAQRKRASYTYFGFLTLFALMTLIILLIELNPTYTICINAGTEQQWAEYGCGPKIAVFTTILGVVFTVCITATFKIGTWIREEKDHSDFDWKLAKHEKKILYIHFMLSLFCIYSLPFFVLGIPLLVSS